MKAIAGAIVLLAGVTLFGDAPGMTGDARGAMQLVGLLFVLAGLIVFGMGMTEK